MGKSSKPRRPYRPRQAGAGIAGRLQPWKLARLFTPLEAALRHTRRGGEVDVDERDRLVVSCAATGICYDIIVLLEAYADIFEKQRRYDSKVPRVNRLYDMAARIAAGTVTKAEVDATLACVESMRAYMALNPFECIRDAALVASLDSHMKELEEARRGERCLM